MRLTLFLFFIVNINAMENFNAALQEVSDSDEINKLCWYLNGLKIKGISELRYGNTFGRILQTSYSCFKVITCIWLGYR